MLENLKLHDYVLHCIFQRQWSPGQIAGFLSFEGSSWYISHNAIYREIEQDNLGVKRIGLNIYFVAVGTPNQRGLNENTNNLLRKDGLHHDLIMDQLSDKFVQAVASRRNHIPRKSLNYHTPLEAFVNQAIDEQLKFLT